jgi:hypothetical protein
LEDDGVGRAALSLPSRRHDVQTHNYCARVAWPWNPAYRAKVGSSVREQFAAQVQGGMFNDLGARWLQRLCPGPHCGRVGVPTTGLFCAQSVPPCLSKLRSPEAARTKACPHPEPIGHLPHIPYHFAPPGRAIPSGNSRLQHASVRSSQDVSHSWHHVAKAHALQPAERTRHGETQVAAQSVPLFLGSSHASRSG